MKRFYLVLACLVLGGLLGSYLTGSYLRGKNEAPIQIPGERASYRDVVKKVLPAVVSIEVRGPVVRASGPRGLLPDDPRIPEELRPFFGDRAPLDEGPRRRAIGFGSGFIIDPSGVILTNYHVVDDTEQVEVRLADGRKLISRDIKADPKTDLAVIRVETQDKLPYLELGDSEAVEIGDRVLAIGAPFGLAGSVTHGIVSGKDRSLHVNMYEDFIQTDAAINPGNSGGPLVSLDGKVIGINSAIKTRSGGFQGIGLAIASNLARDVVGQLQRTGVVKRGYLGVQVRDLSDPELAARLGVEAGQGVLVSQVFEKGPAARAGLKDGDIIVAVAGKPVEEVRDLQRQVARLPVGQTSELTIVRDGSTAKLEVVIDEQPSDYGLTRVPAPQRPESAADSISLEKIGVEVRDMTPALARRLGYQGEAQGIVITRVDSSGIAASAGLLEGTVITHIDRQEVSGSAQAQRLVEQASLEDGILLQTHSPSGGTSYVLLRATR